MIAAEALEPTTSIGVRDRLGERGICGLEHEHPAAGRLAAEWARVAMSCWMSATGTTCSMLSSASMRALIQSRTRVVAGTPAAAWVRTASMSDFGSRIEVETSTGPVAVSWVASASTAAWSVWS
jgi:hypothetical protein